MIVEAAAREARAELVRRGDLRHLLHSDQRTVLAQMRACAAQQFVLEKARRWGGSWLMVAEAVSTCLRYPKCRVPYGSSTDKSLREYVQPTIAALTDEFPADCRPTFNSFDGHWNFPNGAWIHLFGCEDMLKARRGRGPPARKVFLDECGFIPIMGEVVESILRPQLMHLPIEDLACSIVLGSSPASEPDHPFTLATEIAEANGALATRTIHDNPLLSVEQIANFIAKAAEANGMTVEQYIQTDTFKREYLAQRVIDKKLVVLPEWADVRDTQFVAMPRPEYFDAMTILDFGGIHPHGVHLGYLDFQRAAYVIEDELLLRDGENTLQLVARAQEKERAMWGTDRWEGTLRAYEDPKLLENVPFWLKEATAKDAPPQPRSRWCDNDIQLAKDLHQLHGYSVIPTAKDDLELQVNNLRVGLQKLKVFVNPRCVHTDRHWKGTTWNKQRTGFAEKAGEHGDLVACGVYGYRNVEWHRNPFPSAPLTPLERYRMGQPKTLAERLGEVLKG